MKNVSLVYESIYENVYFIISDEMKNVLCNKNIKQYFVDITYYSTPSYTKKYKIFIIIGFNILDNIVIKE